MALDSAYPPIEPNQGVQATAVPLRSTAASDAGRSASPLRTQESVHHIHSHISFHRLVWYHALIRE